MGRRALPRIDRSISIDSVYQELADLTPPWDPDAAFPASGPFEIEIGSGKGLFLTNSATAHPERRYLGVEASIKYAQFSAYRLARQGLNNVRIVRGDAMRFLSEFVQPHSVAAYHVYFPDPWWKERHRRRRVMQPATIEDMIRTLTPGGWLHFWTDVEEYFETVCSMMESFPAFSGPQDVAEKPAEHDLDYRTHFERRMRLNDHPVFRTCFQLRN